MSDIPGTLFLTGVGVRSSIYIHAFLGPIAVWAQYARYGALGTDSNRTITLIFDRIIGNLLLIGIALFVTAIIGATSTTGLSSVEGLVILNLLWIINTCILLLTIAIWSLNWTGPCPGSTKQRQERNQFQSPRGSWNIFPCSIILHSVLLAAFGLWFWTRRDVFHDNNSLVYYWIFGRIPIHNNALHKASLAVYTISAIPGINMIFHAFITLFIPILIMVIRMAVFKHFDNMAFECLMHATALFAFLAQPIYLIVSTELVIKTNYFGESKALDTWTLGDTVFLLIAATSIRTMAKLTFYSWRIYYPGINNSALDPIAQHVEIGKDGLPTANVVA